MSHASFIFLQITVIGKSVLYVGAMILGVNSFELNTPSNPDLPKPSMTSIVPEYIFHPGTSRGHVNHGWLDTYHAFSFGGWHDSTRMHFGALRVLNDDFVAAGKGFNTHPHDNMEIVSIPLEGDLEHEDSMGNRAVIRSGDVQILSAGAGIMHSEKNHSLDESVRFLQIWIFPNERDLTPSYDQERYTEDWKANTLQCLVSPDGKEGVNIHQNAWLQMGEWKHDTPFNYTMHSEGQGVYAFVLEGEVIIDGHQLGRRDALGISKTPAISISSKADSKLLIIEVPMQW